MKQTQSECLCKPVTQWACRTLVSVPVSLSLSLSLSLCVCVCVFIHVCVLGRISIDPLTSLPNVASISHLIDVLSMQCSAHTIYTLMAESHVAHQHTFTHRTNKHAVHYYTPLDYIGFDRIQAGCFSMWIDTNIYFFLHCVLLCGKSHIQYVPFFW